MDMQYGYRISYGFRTLIQNLRKTNDPIKKNTEILKELFGYRQKSKENRLLVDL